MSEAACHSQGGTYCPNAADCSVLKTCVATMKAEASSNNLPMFVDYLGASPSISDATDNDECGRARNYFGFDENFINDQAICDDIEQLKHSKSFKFLEDMYGSGGSSSSSSSSSGCSEPAAAPVTAANLPEATPLSTFDLADIDRCTSARNYGLVADLCSLTLCLFVES